jgi:hypothetical protein
MLVLTRKVGQQIVIGESIPEEMKQLRPGHGKRRGRQRQRFSSVPAFLLPLKHPMISTITAWAISLEA